MRKSRGNNREFSLYSAEQRRHWCPQDRGESDLKATQELSMMVLKLSMEEHFQEKRIEEEGGPERL